MADDGCMRHPSGGAICAHSEGAEARKHTDKGNRKKAASRLAADLIRCIGLVVVNSVPGFSNVPDLPNPCEVDSNVYYTDGYFTRFTADPATMSCD